MIGVIGDVAAAGRRGGQAVRLEPVAQRHVLGVAERRRGQLLALELRRGGDALLHHQLGAAGRGAGDHPDQLAAGGLPGLDRRVRADVGGVQLAGQQSGGFLGAGAERVQLQRDVLAEVLGEEALLDPDQRAGVGDVLEEPEPEGDRCRGAARVRRRGLVLEELDELHPAASKIAAPTPAAISVFLIVRLLSSFFSIKIIGLVGNLLYHRHLRDTFQAPCRRARAVRCCHWRLPTQASAAGSRPESSGVASRPRTGTAAGTAAAVPGWRRWRCRLVGHRAGHGHHVPLAAAVPRAPRSGCASRPRAP